MKFALLKVLSPGTNLVFSMGAVTEFSLIAFVREFIAISPGISVEEVGLGQVVNGDTGQLGL